MCLLYSFTLNLLVGTLAFGYSELIKLPTVAALMVVLLKWSALQPRKIFSANKVIIT